MHTYEQLIETFQLEPHPEGGWYRQTYQCAEKISAAALPLRFGGERSIATAIYFLLNKGNFSAFHRIKSDECWHFYAGDPLEVIIIQPDGSVKIVTMGSEYTSGHHFQYVVPANCWFASRPSPGSTYCFVGCTVAPGFDFADFELAETAWLVNQFPQHENLIHTLTRSSQE